MLKFKDLDAKWQERWEKDKVFKSEEDKSRKKFYVLEMYPYPSASGLHVGHAFNYVIGDVFARYKLMKGFNVLHPMGFDSFGLPAENAAIKNKSHPKIFTEKAISNFVRQQKKLGLTYDWDRMLQSHDPTYFKWDQWIFLQMFKKGLAYKKDAYVNWCPECKTVLANEQVNNGYCWRHAKTQVEIKKLNQWSLKTTVYADELYENIKNLKYWPENIKAMQRNWIGKSYGTEIHFEINNKVWKIFTTRPDTIYGITFMVVSAQHPELESLVTKEQKGDIEKFLKKIRTTSEKNMEDLEKEGAFTGSYAIHPLTGEKIPVYTGNFVVAEYGAGMVMAVPAHDQRDFEFAKKYNIPIKIVISPDAYDLNPEKMSRAYTGDGILINSEKFNSIPNRIAIDEITEHLENVGRGNKTIQYKLRDWLISRQRFWGTPIPIIYCDSCGVVPVPEKDLPVELPENIRLNSSGNPLAKCKEFFETTCPKCDGKARRETDTMDTFVNSSWYFLRYTDPKNSKKIFSKEKVNYWMPIDLYIGGAEHACMHLIYFRFYTKFLRDIGMLDFDEPNFRLFNQGMIHAEDGGVMSKSAGNSVDPIDIEQEFGADTLRFFLISDTLPDKDFNWNSKGIENTHKFLQKIYEFFSKVKIGKSSPRIESKLNSAIKEVTEFIETFKYNLAIIKIRQVFESFEGEMSRKDLESFIKLLTPLTPHLCEELWHSLGNKSYVSKEKFPVANAKKINLEFDAIDEIIEQLVKDVNNVKTLVKFVPKKVVLSVADDWKYDFFKRFKQEFEKTRDVNTLIKKLVDGKNNSEISKIIISVVKNPSKMPLSILNREKEIEVLKESKDLLKKKSGLDIEIGKNNPKALPGKPSVILE